MQDDAEFIDREIADLIDEGVPESADRPEPTPSVPPQRVLSVDALRGFTMFWIVGAREVVLAIAALFVLPLPEDLEYHLNHPEWLGFSAWDMIMPLFLFIVGVAMPFSLGRRVDEGQSLGRIHAKVIVRTFTLFVFGMIAQGNLLELDTTTLHIYCNTLQAIAVGYLISAILLLHTNLLWQVAVTAGLLLSFWGVLAWVAVPGQEAGILEPDMNIALYIDQQILGGFDDGSTYTWILSSLGFAGTVMLGVFGGRALRSGLPSLGKLGLLVLLGLACLGGGWAWDKQLPIIKHLWTSSMVLWAGGWSFLLLAFFYLVIDVVGLRFLAFPFVVIGRNAIFIYMATHVIDFGALSNPFVFGLAQNFGEWWGEPYALALKEVAKLLVTWLILLYLYRKRTFLKI